MLKVVYVISVILLFILSFILKKKEEKINLTITFFISIIAFSCYNIVVCLFLKMLSLNTNLLLLSIFNYIVSGIFIYKIIKDKEIQKYFIIKKEIIAVGLIIFVGLIVALIVFGVPFNIPYVQVDASNHYGMMTEFYETGEVKLSSIPGAYINNGIFFKIFFNENNRFIGYTIFVICEIIKLILSGILFYLTISKYINKKIPYLIGIIMSCIYMISYPLNGMLSGFVYLQMAVNIANVIFIVMEYYKDINNSIKNILLFLLTFGLMFTYYILVPPVFIALFLYELKDFKKNKLKVIKNILIIFLVPCIAGITFFLLPGFLDSYNNLNPIVHMGSSQAQLGYIFVNYYSMFWIFVPFNILYLVDKIRKKQIDFMVISFIVMILYIIIALILQFNGLLARYYTMKPYYLLWLVMLIITAKTIFEILDKQIETTYKVLVCIVFFIYVLGVIYSILSGRCHLKIFEKEKETSASMFNIYKINRTIALHENFDMIYIAKELKLLEEVTRDFNNETKILFVEDVLNREWLRQILLIEDNNKNQGYAPLDEGNVEKIIKYLLETDEEIYIVCYQNTFVELCFKELTNEISKNMNLIGKEDKLFIYTNK